MSISILMPAYNEEKYVTKTINSLSDQTYKEWELIVIDDGSNDHTPEIVKQFADNDDRIRYFREQNSGQLTALSYGSQFVRGEIVTLLHSDDDLMDNNALARNVSLLTENKCDGLFCDLVSIDENGKYSGVVRTAHRIGPSSLAMLYLRGGSNIIPDIFFVKREAFDNVLSSYITWGMQYWLKFEDTRISTLDLRKVVPWYKYRVYSGNYGHSEIGKFELSTGGLRTILEIGTRMRIPFLRLQRLLVRILKTRMTPMFKQGTTSSKDLRDMVMYVIRSRYGGNIPKNHFFEGITGFYTNFPSKRTIRLTPTEDDVFVGKDTFLFFKLMEKNKLPSTCEYILEEAASGFGKILVKNKIDRERTKKITRFLNLLTEVEIK